MNFTLLGIKLSHRAGCSVFRSTIFLILKKISSDFLNSPRNHGIPGLWHQGSKSCATSLSALVYIFLPALRSDGVFSRGNVVVDLISNIVVSWIAIVAILISSEITQAYRVPLYLPSTSWVYSVVPITHYCPGRDFARKAKSRGASLVTRGYIKESTYTWIFENRVSKNFNSFYYLAI